MKLRPLHDRVIVKRLENETKTASGIVIPDNAAEKPDQGEVLAVGPGRKSDKGELIALNVKVGDRVLFGKYSGQTVKVDGDELLVMPVTTDRMIWNRKNHQNSALPARPLKVAYFLKQACTASMKLISVFSSGVMSPAG